MYKCELYGDHNISVKIVADSISKYSDVRITTYELEYPRFIHCFDSETEVLCRQNGGHVPVFMRFSEAAKLDCEVAQVTEDLLISFVKPTAWIENQFNGQLVKFQNQRLDFMVTDEHRLFVGSRKKDGDKKEIILAKDLLGDHTQKRFYKSGILEKLQGYGTNLVKLVAYFISDGTLPCKGKQAIFHLRKQRKIDEVCRLLSNLGVEYTIRPYLDGTTNIVFNRYDWMEECYTSNGGKRVKCFPALFFNMNLIDFEAFKQGLLESDGCVANNEFNTHSSILIEQLQSLFHVHGEAFNIKKCKNGTYKVKFLKEDTPILRKDKHSPELVDYIGTVHCVSVPTGLIMVRRNGIVHISGNCELMTHRCLSGRNKLDFDLPKSLENGNRRIHNMTIKEFHDKWHIGSSSRKSSRFNESKSFDRIDPEKIYSAKELSILLNYSDSHIRTKCRKSEMVVQNPLKARGEDYLIKGQDCIDALNSPKMYNQNIKSRLTKMKLRMLNEETNQIENTFITDIWEVGIKKTYRLKAGKYEVVATDDHLFLTDKGWKKLCDIVAGVDSVITSGVGTDEPKDSKRLKKINGKWVSRFNKSVLSEISERQGNFCYTCGKKDILEIHHVVPVHENADLAFDKSNVIAVCNNCHKHVHHKNQDWQGGNKLIGKPVVVDSIEFECEEMTYDLSVESDFHNFLTNGVVVHNCFSRNAMSSRAVPVSKMIEHVQNQTALPVFWGKNQSGMQANEECNELINGMYTREEWWGLACKSMVEFAQKFANAGYHKQIVNRLLEPFQMIKVIVTATEFDNFFNLRCHKDAQPEIKYLADLMLQAYNSSIPETLSINEWHTPYVDHLRDNDGKLLYLVYLDDDIVLTPPVSIREALAVSSSCCAQVSYRKNDTSLEKAEKIYKQLVESEPVHASAFEHCATPMSYQLALEQWDEGVTHLDRNGDCWSGNFKEWIQYRQLIPNNVCNEYEGIYNDN